MASDYDYISALESGVHPEFVNGNLKWRSRASSGAKEGLILKSLEHPTILKTLLEEVNKGYLFWYKDPEERKLYTYNKLEDAVSRYLSENAVKNAGE